MFISTNISQISYSKYWKVDVWQSVPVCSRNMEFRSSSTTTWHLLYCIFSFVALPTHCDDKATTSYEMACHSTIWHNLSDWSLPLPRISDNLSNLVLSLSNCMSMTPTMGAVPAGWPGYAFLCDLARLLGTPFSGNPRTPAKKWTNGRPSGRLHSDAQVS